MVPDFRYLEDPGEAGEVLGSLTGEEEIAFDLEADSLHSYREKICLMQISTASRSFVVDPFTCREAFGELASLLGNPGVRKVVHGGDYDVRLLKKDLGIGIRNLFDTMVAAQLAGREQYGLAALLEEEFSVRLEKKYQRADWSARPLSPELLAYAALDTAWLIPLKKRLEEDLRRLGRVAWAEEDFRLLEKVEVPPEKMPSALDIKGGRRLEPRQQALLQRLVDLREAMARKLDRPPFKVFGGGVLLAWAEDPPRSRRKVLSTPGASKRILGLLAEDIVASLARPVTEEEVPERRREPFEPMTREERRRLQSLKKARTEMEEELGLPPGLLVNNATLEGLSRLQAEEVPDFMASRLKGWQKEVAGERLARVLTPAGL